MCNKSTLSLWKGFKETDEKLEHYFSGFSLYLMVQSKINERN